MAERIGSDGEGKEGLVGYFEFLAVEYPRIYCSFLRKLLQAEQLKEQLQNRS